MSFGAGSRSRASGKPGALVYLNKAATFSLMTRSFSELTKGFTPERRERIEQRKAEIRQCLNLPFPLNFIHGSHHHG